LAADTELRLEEALENALGRGAGDEEAAAGPPSWAGRHEDPAAAVEDVRRGAARWRAAELERADVIAEQTAATPAEVAADLELRHRERAHEKATHEHERAQKGRDALLRELTDLVGERTADEIQAEHECAIRNEATALDRAERARQAADAQVARSTARLEGARDELARRDDERARARQVLEAALQRVGVDESEVRRLRLDEDWIKIETAALRRLADAARETEAVLRERSERLDEHENDARPEHSRERCEAERLRLAEAVASAMEATASLRHRLERDDRAHERALALGPALERQRERARVWQQMSEAIGSASGTAFQRFAQSLTLDLLLFHANGQLRQLKPRYSLQRVPGEDLELQLVDHDLGDEVRSIHGLSGGEQFLVSLALALGLAGLSAEQCQIESLFIDEGFGSLDAESLDVALDALDAVQATGRQIGLISHVPGLAERVGAEVRVNPVSSGRSRIRIVDAFAS
jgi:exonuclease SbcC